MEIQSPLEVLIANDLKYRHHVQSRSVQIRTKTPLNILGRPMKRSPDGSPKGRFHELEGGVVSTRSPSVRRQNRAAYSEKPGKRQNGVDLGAGPWPPRALSDGDRPALPARGRAEPLGF